jgi:glycosyltransferase involved in cell wall biosynthesis
MNILIPTHHFTDNPKSGLHTEIWNYTKHLAEIGHHLFVVATHTDLQNETLSSLKQNHIHLYHLRSIPTHGFGPSEALLTFLFSFLLQLKHRFHWIIIIDATKTPFSRFKPGVKLACRLLRPPDQDTQQILSGSDWSYDRRHKDSEENWQDRVIPISYRLLGFFTNQIWSNIFPIQRVGQNADLLLCQNQATLKYYRSQDFQNLHYLPNGVENYRLDKIPNPKPTPKKPFTFLFIGRIAKRKGIFYLLEAFKKLNQSHPQTKLIVIGKGSHLLTRKFKKQAGQLLKQNIILKGELDRYQTIRLLKSCHIVVSPEIFATLPNVVLEALYCQKPVIGPLHGGVSDIIQDGVNGFLVDPRNIKDLQQKMEYYLLHPRKAKLMATRGQRLIKSQFTWSKIIKSLDQALKDHL